MSIRHFICLYVLYHKMMSQYGSNNEGTQVVSFHKGDRSCNECRCSSWQKQLNIHFSPNRVSFVCWKGVCKRWFHSLFIFTSCVIPFSGNLGLCSNLRVCRVKIEVYTFIPLYFQQFWVWCTAWRLCSSIKYLCKIYILRACWLTEQHPVSISWVWAVLCKYSKN